MNKNKILIYSVTFIVLIFILFDVNFYIKGLFTSDEYIIKEYQVPGGNGAVSKKIPPALSASFNENGGVFEDVLLLSSDEKIQFLQNILQSLKSYDSNGGKINGYFNNHEALFFVLVQFMLSDDESVAESSLLAIKLFAMAFHSTKKTDSNIPNFSESEEVKLTIGQLITDTNIDDDVRGAAIDAHSWLYPPDDMIIKELEKIIIEGGVNNGDALSSVLMTYAVYKKLYDYDIPASTLKVVRSLIDHPSDSVKVDALAQLRRSVGKPILPVLLDELKTSNSMGIANMTILNILALDLSDTTINQIKEIGARSLHKGKSRLINRYTSAKSIEHLRKVRKEKELLKNK